MGEFPIQGSSPLSRSPPGNRPALHISAFGSNFSGDALFIILLQRERDPGSKRKLDLVFPIHSSFEQESCNFLSKRREKSRSGHHLLLMDMPKTTFFLGTGAHCPRS